MKKLLYFTFIFLLILLSSCGKENPQLKVSLPLDNDMYQLITRNATINLNDYIKYEEKFTVTYNNNEYTSDNLNFELAIGDNLFTVKTKYETIQIKIIRETNLEHTHTIITIPGSDATCINTGLTEGKKCSECNEVLVPQNVIPTTSHNYLEGKCSICGGDDPAFKPNTPDDEAYYFVTLVDSNLKEIYSIKVKENDYFSFESFTITNVPEGYTWNNLFKYGNTLNNLNNETSSSSLQITSNLYFQPIYTPCEYQIELHYNNASMFKSIKTGEALIFENIQIDGYKFLGWYSNDVLIENGTLYTPSLGKVFTAKFEKLTEDIKTYSITYKYKDLEKTVNYQLNDAITEFKPTITGYEFDGWYLNDQLFTNTTFTYQENIVLIAKFVPLKFKIIYTNIDTPYEETVKYEDYYTLYEPIKTGYTFSHWEYEGNIFNEGTWTYLKDITLTAVWNKNTISTISLNLETFGGTVDNIVEINNNLIELPTPELKGYIFKYWCTDSALTNKITTLSATSYNNEKLYAYYEYDSDDLKGQLIVTRYNSHASNYDELAMFDSSQSGFTSKYWHKVAIKKNNDGYYVSAIASSGESLSTLGTYDYVILAYADYDNYNNFINLGYSVGDLVYMVSDPKNSSNGATTNIISFVKANLGNSGIVISEYLSSIYSSYQTVTSNINLVNSYNGFNITWKSSNRDAITTSGKYTKPYTTRNVTLSAYVGEEKVYEFSVVVPGINSTSTALSTGYIYTPYTITQNAMNTLDIIYCAFLEIDNSGDWTNLSRFTSNINTYIKEKAAIAGTKIVVSVNQSNSTAFPTVAANATLREKLADNIVNVIKTLGLDGVDIDWETPTSSEAPTFTLLMEAIYRKVKAANPEYLVTAAIGGGMWQPPKYDLTNSGKYLDYVNLMTYSMATGNSYYQNSLYKSTKGATLTSCSIDESVKIFNDLTIPNSKILVGIPFYTTVQTGSGGPGSKVGTGKSIWYDKLFTTYAISDTMKEYFDDECGVPYRYDATNKIFISFDNEQSIKIKCEYINTLGLAGIMYWQYGQDVNDMLSNAIDKYINA